MLASYSSVIGQGPPPAPTPPAWEYFEHAPLPDAACVAAELTTTASSSGGEEREALELSLLDPRSAPFRCRLDELDAACGARGRCVAYDALYNATGWSWASDADDGTCYWLAFFAEKDADASEYGVCVCDAGFDGDGCDTCQAGLAGAACDVPFVATRRSLASFLVEGSIDAQLSTSFDDVVPDGGMLDWIHTTVGKLDYPAACRGAPHNPHKNSLWLMQWHRPLLRHVESTLVSRGLEGMPFWNVTDDDDDGGGLTRRGTHASPAAATTAAFALHPDLLQRKATGAGKDTAGDVDSEERLCSSVTLRALSEYLGIVGTNVLGACRGVDDEPACLATYGVTVASVFNETQLLSHEFIVFLEHVKHLHLFVHCWFAVAGYVGPGGWCSPWGKSLPQILSDTDAANTVTGGTAQITKAAEACSKLAPMYQGEDPATPLFFMFHTYLDALFEKWMRQHGASAACDPALRSYTDDLWRSGQPRDAHPASCVAQSALYAGTISLSQTCVPSDPAWGYRFEGIPSWGIDDDPSLAAPLPDITSLLAEAASAHGWWWDGNLWTTSQWIMTSPGYTGLFHYQEFLLGLTLTLSAGFGLQHLRHRRRVRLLEIGHEELKAVVETSRRQPYEQFTNEVS